MVETVQLPSDSALLRRIIAPPGFCVVLFVASLVRSVTGRGGRVAQRMDGEVSVWMTR